MTRTLWIEPFGGIAGDMFLAALLDLGDDRFTLDDLRGLADELVPGEARLACAEVWRGSMRGAHLTVETPETGAAPHRGLRDLVALLDRSSLPRRARDRAVAALTALAEAEARVHGTTVDGVHFHEVGAVDTLVDVGGAALALERLGVEAVRCSPPLVGSGTVRCAHGVMPVPAPAVAELLRGRPVRVGGGRERTTPTAAALLVAWTDGFDEPGTFATESVGYGAGTADPPEGPPNLVRVQLGEEAGGTAGATRATAWLCEVNLDDMTPEEVGHAVQAVRAAGALEAWTHAVHMKKDRPGVVLSVLARAGRRAALEEALFATTSTFGVRWSAWERTECARASVEVRVDGQSVRVKVRRRPGSESSAAWDLFPEHDDLVRASAELRLPLAELRRRAVAAALELPELPKLPGA